MDYQKEVMTLMNQINTKMEDFTTKIRNEHHKWKDAIWGMLYDAWQDT